MSYTSSEFGVDRLKIMESDSPYTCEVGHFPVIVLQQSTNDFKTADQMSIKLGMDIIFQTRSLLDHVVMFT